MEEDLTLFEMAPTEKQGEIQNTNVEFLQIPLEKGMKAKMIEMLEKMCEINNQEVYADLLFNMIKEKYEENNS